MKQPRQPVFVGLLALIVLLLAPIGVLVLVSGGIERWIGTENVILLRADAAAGVRVGTPVTVAGLRVGRVQRVGFEDQAAPSSGVAIELALRAAVVLRQGSSARIVSAAPGGGQAAIDLTPGPADAPPLERGATLRAEVSSGAGALLPPSLVWAIERSADRFGAAADAATPLLADLGTLVEPRAAGAVDAGQTPNLASAVARLDAAAAGLGDVLGDRDVRRKVRETIDNLHAASADGRALLAEARDTIVAARGLMSQLGPSIEESRASLAGAVNAARESSEQLKRVMDAAARILAALDPVAQRLARGEGTLGKLIADDRLYEGFLLMLKRMSEERR